MKEKKRYEGLPIEIRRRHVLQVRVRDSEKATLAKKAEENHLPLTAYVRMAAMKYKAKWRAEN